MRFIFTLLLLCSCWTWAFAQMDTLTTLSNQYTAITDLDDCLATITVADTTGFAPGREVLIIQMQGAQMNESNSGAFGNIQNLLEAGHYEWNTVQSRTANVLTLARALQYPYEPGAGLQAVSFTQYTAAYVSDTLVAQAWDGTTGGVIVLSATDSLVLAAPVLADGAGFRGGTSVQATGIDCSVFTFNNNYFYDAGNWRGAPKGEGIVALIAEKEYGRGAQANGGGGGNNHNSGGGGGANVSNGGQGGENNEPSFGGCDGFSPGRGGKGLANDTTRFFLGGGGGAGHRNNNQLTSGGDGGGLIIVRTETLRFAGGYLSANGQAGDSPLGDGAGGGGAGGTLVVLAETVSGTPDLSATGGDGGNADNGNANRCYGPGGGGSGGRLLTNQATLTADLSVGIAGMSINSTNCSGTNEAVAGNPGLETTLQELLTGTEDGAFAFGSYVTDTTVCPGADLLLSVDFTGDAELQWQQLVDGDWVDLTNGTAFSGTTTATLGLTDVDTDLTLRLVATLCDDSTVLTDVITVQAAAIVPVADFTFTTNGLTVIFTNLSTDATSYLWNFGDGQTSTELEPTYTYDQPGTYIVSLQAFNDCGNDVASQQVDLNALAALFTADPIAGCTPLEVQFTDLSQGTITQREWLFSGGDPASSTATDPLVTYTMPGSFPVTLIVSDDAGSDTLMFTDYIEVGAPPTGSFTFAVNDLTVTFTATTTLADAFVWDFGDGQFSNVPNPTHTYAAPGVYTVTFSTSNDCGEVLQSEVIDLSVLQAGFSATPTTGCAPLEVLFTNNSTGTIADYLWSFPGGAPTQSMLPNPVVTYTAPGLYDVTLVVSNTDDSSTLTETSLIEVNATPTAAFTQTTTNLTVDFTALLDLADAVLWDFGDGQTSTVTNPQHTYTTPGTYPVTLTATNACGTDTFTESITVGNAINALIIADRLGGCAPLVVQFDNGSQGNFTTVQWSFPGGDPATSTAPAPQVTYDTPGEYVATLTITDANGNTDTNEVAITVQTSPSVDFTYTIDGLTVSFSNQSTNASSFGWQFGDGQIGTEENPVYTYAQPGIYDVTLNAQGPFCSQASGQTLVVGTVDTEDLAQAGIRIFPNPFSDWLAIAGIAGGQITVYTAMGQRLFVQQLPSETSHIETTRLPPGSYYLLLEHDGRRWMTSVVK